MHCVWHKIKAGHHYLSYTPGEFDSQTIHCNYRYKHHKNLSLSIQSKQAPKYRIFTGDLTKKKVLVFVFYFVISGYILYICTNIYHGKKSQNYLMWVQPIQPAELCANLLQPETEYVSESEIQNLISIAGIKQFSRSYSIKILSNISVQSICSYAFHCIFVFFSPNSILLIKITFPFRVS